MLDVDFLYVWNLHNAKQGAYKNAEPTPSIETLARNITPGFAPIINMRNAVKFLVKGKTKSPFIVPNESYQPNKSQDDSSD